MSRPVTVLLCCTLLACGSDGNEPKPLSCATGPATEGPFSPAWKGSLVLTTEGAMRGMLFGNATAYQQGRSNAAYSILSGYIVDDEDRPVSELFLLLRSVIAEGEQELVPVTLSELRSALFFPSGAIGAFAKREMPYTEDFLHWFVAKSGCIRITESIQPTASTPGRFTAIAAMRGEWRSSSSEALLGQGTVIARLSGPMLDLRTGVAQPSDSMGASISGPRAGVFSDDAIKAFQVLHPAQTRLVIVGTQAADTTREIWLSIAGVPAEGDSVPLTTVTLAEARATRPATAKSFAMVRMLAQEGTTPVVRELWTSTSGYVKFERLTRNGALALCGAATGSFRFSAQGTSVASPGTSLGSMNVTGGNFRTRMTIVARADTLVDPAIVPTALPNSTMGFGCP